MKITVVTGSRADYGLLEWPIKLLKEDPYFQVEVVKVWNFIFTDAYEQIIAGTRPDVLMILGDRYEILACATAAHLQRIPIAHIAGGDVTEGSYDDAMRDAISRMATIHFVTSTSAMARLTHMGYRNIHLVGSPGIDYIKHADWKRERPYDEPYVVVSYQAETIDGTVEIDAPINSLTESGLKVFMLPNPDAGSDAIRKRIAAYRTGEDRYSLCSYVAPRHNVLTHDFLNHDVFLNLIYHCDEFIGNSSSMLYEAPFLQVKTRMIGKRQRGRVIPWGDGLASERIINILKYTHL